MATRENEDLIRRYLAAVWEQGDLAAIDTLCTADFVRHGPPGTEGEIRGRDGFKGLVTMYRTSFPDLQVPIEGQASAGDTVVMRWTARGTPREALMGTPASDKPIAVPGVIIDRIEEGRIAEEWASYDTLLLLQQVGALPAPGQARG